MIARNVLAERLLIRLTSLNVTAQPGFYGTSNFCIGVAVTSMADAFRLGAKLGDEYGTVKIDQWGTNPTQFIAFVDTKVTS